VTVNAIVDALSGFGITHIEMPVTPAKIWQAIADAKVIDAKTDTKTDRVAAAAENASKPSKWLELSGDIR
jgi:carbon-monoxide dehydrogenase large subunit